MTDYNVKNIHLHFYSAEKSLLESIENYNKVLGKYKSIVSRKTKIDTMYLFLYIFLYAFSILSILMLCLWIFYFCILILCLWIVVYCSLFSVLYCVQLIIPDLRKEIEVDIVLY